MRRKTPEVLSVAPENSIKKQRQVPLATAGLLMLAIGLGAFALGTRSDEILTSFSGSKSSPASLDFSSLNDIYKKLRSKYDGEIDAAKLVDGAKHGLVDAAGDPYTVYLNAEEAKEFSGDINGTFEGIGAELGKTDGQLTIMSLVGDSPAQAAGLQARDVIYKINDEDSSKLTIGEAVKKIRGAKGTSVKLSILRGDTTKDYTITRDTISTPSVKSEVLDGGVGYIKISRFGDDTSSLARKAAQDLRDKNVSKIILDLRGNGGGLLNSAQSVASLWLDNKVVVSERQGGKVIDTLKSSSNSILGGIKTIVLVDGGSASASEIVAGALKDHGVATLVGEKTFGKGSVQVLETLPDGGQLKVTVAKWYTPNGKNIDKEGITPDKVISISEADIKAGRDPQKEAALGL